MKGFKVMIRRYVLLAFTFAALLMAGVCGAQTQELNVGSTIESVRADMQADRAKMVAAAMNFSDKDGAVFWPIYRKYEYERATVGDRRVGVMKEYMAKFSTLSDADAKAMSERMIDCDSELAALKKKYFKKLNSVLPALTVAKFFQLEHRIDLVMDVQVESSLPPLFHFPEANTQTGPQLDTQTN